MELFLQHGMCDIINIAHGVENRSRDGAIDDHDQFQQVFDQRYIREALKTIPRTTF